MIYISYIKNSIIASAFSIPSPTWADNPPGIYPFPPPLSRKRARGARIPLTLVGEGAPKGREREKRSGCSGRRFPGLPGTDAHDLLHGYHEDLAVADLAGAGGLDDGFNRLIHDIIG